MKIKSATISQVRAEPCGCAVYRTVDCIPESRSRIRRGNPGGRFRQGRGFEQSLPQEVIAMRDLALAHGVTSFSGSPLGAFHRRATDPIGGLSRIASRANLTASRPNGTACAQPDLLRWSTQKHSRECALDFAGTPPSKGRRINQTRDPYMQHIPVNDLVPLNWSPANCQPGWYSRKVNIESVLKHCEKAADS